jgi:hypothetical protein
LLLSKVSWRVIKDRAHFTKTSLIIERYLRRPV